MARCGGKKLTSRLRGWIYLFRSIKAGIATTSIWARWWFVRGINHVPRRRNVRLACCICRWAMNSVDWMWRWKARKKCGQTSRWASKWRWIARKVRHRSRSMCCCQPSTAGCWILPITSRRIRGRRFSARNATARISMTSTVRSLKVRDALPACASVATATS